MRSLYVFGYQLRDGKDEPAPVLMHKYRKYGKGLQILTFKLCPDDTKN
jgi:hypothetical protein